MAGWICFQSYNGDSGKLVLGTELTLARTGQVEHQVASRHASPRLLSRIASSLGSSLQGDSLYPILEHWVEDDKG